MVPIKSKAEPKYWRHQRGDETTAAIRRYLQAPGLVTHNDVKLIRNYLRAWILSGTWDRKLNLDYPAQRGLDALRLGVVELRCVQDVRGWLEKANEIGIDPL